MELKVRSHFLCLVLLFSALVWSATGGNLSEQRRWPLIQRMVQNLKKENKHKEAYSSLVSYEKQYPKSQFLYEIWKEKSMLLIEGMNSLEKGAYFLEKAMRFPKGKKDTTLKNLRNKIAPGLTEKRLGLWQHYLKKTFSKKLSYPKSLDKLFSQFGSLKKRNLYDGWGRRLIYFPLDSPVTKGEDFLSYKLFSAGPDGKQGNEDDIAPKFSEKDIGSQPFVVMETYIEDGVWKAEVLFENKKKRSKMRKKIRADDYLLGYRVFGIGEEGVVLLKDAKLVICKK